jgi:hypothetical protein
MATMNLVSARGFSGVSFHFKKCPQGVAALLFKKTPIFGCRGSKLDLLTVHYSIYISSKGCKAGHPAFPRDAETFLAAMVDRCAIHGASSSWYSTGGNIGRPA